MSERVAGLLFKIRADTTSLREGMKKTQASVTAMQKTFATLKASLIGVFGVASVGMVVNFVKKSMQAYDQQIKAETALTTALDGRSDITKRLASEANRLQQISLFNDEDIVKGQSFLAMMKLNEAEIKRITPLILDFAQAKEMDLKSAFDLVAKSIGSGTNALQRYGITIKGAVGSNERLESAVNSLSSAFGGQAEAAAKVGSAPWTQLNKSLGELAETLGQTLAPALNKAATALTNFFNKFNAAWSLEKEMLAASDFSEFEKFLYRWTTIGGKRLKYQFKGKSLTGYDNPELGFPPGYNAPTEIPEVSVTYKKPQPIKRPEAPEYAPHIGWNTAWGMYQEDKGFQEQLERAQEAGKQLTIISTEIKRTMIDLTDTIRQGMGDVIQSFLSGIEGLISGEMNIKEFGLTMLKAVGQFMQKLGAAILLTGEAIKALYAAFANPIAAAAAGLALMAAGTVIAGIASRGIKAEIGAGGGGTGMIRGGGHYGETFKVETVGVVKGSDIFQVSNRYNRYHGSVT